MLQRIKARNFKKHQDIEIEFGPGVNLIVGPNWAGKSTLLWAVVYAFFGPTYVPGGSKLISPLSGKGKPEVSLWFSGPDGQDYCVERNASTASLMRLSGSDSKKLANGAAQVTAAVEELLGLSASLFCNLRMSRQDEAGAILTLGAAALGQIVNEITQVDVIDRITEASAKEATKLELAISALQDYDLEELQTAVDTAKCTQAAEADRVERLTNQKAELTEQHRSAHYAVISLQEQNLKHQAALEKTQELRSERDRVAGQLEGLSEEASQQPDDLTPLQEDLKLHLMHERIDRELSGHRSRLEQVSQNLSQTVPVSEEQYEDAQVLLEKLQADHESALLEAHKTYAKLESMQENLNKAICPACQRPFDERDAKQLSREYEALLAQYNEVLLVSISNTERQVESARKHASDVSYRYNQVRDLQLQQSQLEGAVNALVAEQAASPKSSLWASSEELRQALSHAQITNQRIRHAQQLQARLQDRLTELNAKIVAAAPIGKAISTEEMRQAEETAEGLYRELTLVYEAHQSSVAELKILEHQVSVAKQALVEAQDSEKVRSDLLSRQDQFSRLTKYLRKNRDAFTSRIWDSILSSCSAFVSAATCGVITQMERTVDGTFQFLEDGTWMPVGAASGVQRAILGVGVRLALAHALGAGGRFLLLDEITAGARSDLSIEIVRSLGDTQEQALVVSHLQEDAAVADHLIQF